MQLELPVSGSMLEQEERIQEVLNEAGRLFTGEVLSRFDTDGAPILIGAIKWTSKGREPKD